MFASALTISDLNFFKLAIHTENISLTIMKGTHLAKMQMSAL